MKARDGFASQIALDLAMYGLFYAWQFHGITGAGNVVMTYVAFSLAALGFSLFVPDTAYEDTNIVRAKGQRSYTIGSAIIEAAALAWIGHSVLAVLLLFLSLAWVVRKDHLLAIQGAKS